MSAEPRKKNIFLIGLDSFNREKLEGLPDAGSYRFHGLLRPEDIDGSREYRIADLIERAVAELEAFDGPIDAVVGFSDFPATSMVPILCRRLGLEGPSLEAVLRCEHKYWSRLVLSREMPEHIPDFVAFDPFDAQALEGITAELAFPFWVKPIKSAGSWLGFRIDGPEHFRHAQSVLQAEIGHMAGPFDVICDHADLPEAVAALPPHACLAEAIISGWQCTVEGGSAAGRIDSHGIVDSIRYPGSSSFFRYQYPSALPEPVQERMIELSRRAIAATGLDRSAFNIEFFWEENSDRIWLLEINPRISQSHSEIFEKVDGASNHAVTLAAALGQAPDFPRRQGDFALGAKIFLRTLSDGVVEAVPDPARLAELARRYPGTIFHPQVEVGMKRSEALIEQDSYSYHLCSLYMGADSEADLLDKYGRLREELGFRILRETLGAPHLPATAVTRAGSQAGRPDTPEAAAE